MSHLRWHSLGSSQDLMACTDEEACFWVAHMYSSTHNPAHEPAQSTLGIFQSTCTKGGRGDSTAGLFWQCLAPANSIPGTHARIQSKPMAAGCVSWQKEWGGCLCCTQVSRLTDVSEMGIMTQVALEPQLHAIFEQVHTPRLAVVAVQVCAPICARGGQCLAA